MVDIERDEQARLDAPAAPGRRLACRFRRAFTLIEILVVVAIIALLISILLPSLSKAREQAKTLVCKTRLTQLYRGHVFYAADNRGLFPHWDWWLWDATQTDGARQFFYPNSWIYRVTGGVRSTDSRRWVEYGDIYRYVKDKEAYFCPSDNKRRKAPSIGGGGVYGNYPIHSFNRIIDPHQFIQNKIDSRFKVSGAPPIINGAPMYLTANFINPDKLRPGVFQYQQLPEIEKFFSVAARVVMLWEPDQGIGDNPLATYSLNDGHSSIVYYGSQDQISARHSQRKGHVLYWDGHPELVEADRWNSYPKDKYVLWKGLGGGTPPKP